MIYKVWVRLEAEYDDIEADSEEEAFWMASDAAMDGGDWQYTIEPIEEEVDFEPDFSEMGFDPYLGQYTDDC